jgi:hypothetical protein
MTEPNGGHVSRAELAAHIKGIDQRFQDVAADIVEIRYGITGIVDAMARAKQDRVSRLRAWGPPLLAALVSASVALPVALLLH